VHSVIALSTGSLHSYGLARVFDLAARAGYDGVEVLVDHRWDTRQPAYLRRLADDHGLPVVALHSPFLPDVCDWPGDQLGRLKQTVALAQALDVSLVVTHLPLRWCAVTGHWHAPRPRFFKSMVPVPRREPYRRFLHEGLAAFEAQAGVTVAVENMPASRCLGVRIDRHWDNHPAALSCFPHLTLDTTHVGTWGLDLLAFYEQLHGRVAHVHLSNYDGREHRLPPDGRLSLAPLLRRLAHDGYRGVITVETCPQVMHAEDEEICLGMLRRALAFCREHVGG